MQENTKLAIAAGVGLVVGYLILPQVFGVPKVRAADLEGPAYVRGKDAVPAVGGVSAYAGVHGGITMANTELSSGPFSLDGLGSHGFVGGLHLGVDYISANRIMFGAYGSYDWQTTEFSVATGGPSFTVGFGDSWSVGGRVGYVFERGSKLYALLGYRHTDVEWPTGLTGVPSALTGIDLGLGMSMPIAKNVELGIEGIWTKYQTEKIGSIDLDTHQLGVMGRLNFQIGTLN